jgi:hypothetical protein
MPCANRSPLESTVVKPHRLFASRLGCALLGLIAGCASSDPERQHADATASDTGVLPDAPDARDTRDVNLADALPVPDGDASATPEAGDRRDGDLGPESSALDVTVPDAALDVSMDSEDTSPETDRQVDAGGEGGAQCIGPVSQTCGYCGEQTRTCHAGGWSDWSECAGAGVCAPNSVQACGDGGGQRCTSACAWGTCGGFPVTPSPPTSVTATGANAQTVGSNSFSSSTRLVVSWSLAQVDGVDHVRVRATEAIGGSTVTVTSTSAQPYTTLSELKAGTTYSIEVTSCGDALCAQSASAAAIDGATSDEYWQLQGTGASYATLSTPVAEGSVLSWAMRWGAEAGPSYESRYQYYYKTNASGREGIAIATTTSTVADVRTLLSFVPSTTVGLRSACSSALPDTSSCPTTRALELNSMQAVPLKSGALRLFFDGSDLKDHKLTRIYYLDSRDGYVGQDFHPGSQMHCGGIGSTDYGTSGACAPTLVVDVAGPGKLQPLMQARQFKVGYDWNYDPLWDEAPGTFMLITGDDYCNRYPNALFYATWNGSAWTVETDTGGCAKPLVPLAHGPVLVPRGSAAYKLYYEDAEKGQTSGKPLRLLYADGSRTGDRSRVEMTDWETTSTARQVHFLWPDGTMLNAQEEAGLGDHMVLTPNRDLETQYMFVNRGGIDNVTWNRGSMGLGLAALANP